MLLTVPLSADFHPNKRPPFFNFQKTRWNDSSFTLTLIVILQKNTLALSLSSAVALFTSLTINAAKFSIPFGCVKQRRQGWWSAEVEDAVSERSKAFLSLIKAIKIVRLTSLLPTCFVCHCQGQG